MESMKTKITIVQLLDKGLMEFLVHCQWIALNRMTYDIILQIFLAKSEVQTATFFKHIFSFIWNNNFKIIFTKFPKIKQIEFNKVTYALLWEVSLQIAHKIFVILYHSCCNIIEYKTYSSLFLKSLTS